MIILIIPDIKNVVNILFSLLIFLLGLLQYTHRDLSSRRAAVPYTNPPSLVASSFYSLSNIVITRQLFPITIFTP